MADIEQYVAPETVRTPVALDVSGCFRILVTCPIVPGHQCAQQFPNISDVSNIFRTLVIFTKFARCEFSPTARCYCTHEQSTVIAVVKVCGSGILQLQEHSL